MRCGSAADENGPGTLTPASVELLDQWCDDDASHPAFHIDLALEPGAVGDSRQSYANRGPHGYCRCAEPVKYVREIHERYEAYIGTLASLLENQRRATK